MRNYSIYILANLNFGTHENIFIIHTTNQKCRKRILEIAKFDFGNSSKQIIF